MAFKATEWEFSKEVDCSQIPVEEGVQFAQIMDADYDEKDGKYRMTLQSFTNSAEFKLTYWLFQDDQNGARVPNSRARNTLISLGKALAGEPIGIPNPVDIVGGVVSVDVKYSKPGLDGRSYPRVYVFNAVPEDIAINATIDQFYLSN